MKGRIGRILATSTVLALVAVGLIPATARASTQEDRVPRTNEGRRPTQISAGWGHTCALTPAGAVDCWGSDSYGQAADQAGPYTQISAGRFHTCALTPAGAVDCWGRNTNGQADDQAGPYTQVSAGSYHTCALTTAGAADCWGDATAGKADDHAGPYTQISAGESHTCALTPAGAADCWGENNYGQSDAHAGPYTQISTGYYYTCALTPAGAADCWGDNWRGQAGYHAGPYTQISAGESHTCALTPSGAADCWGYNAYGQATGQAGPYTQIAVGYWHTCGLAPDGGVGCWGRNIYGQAASQTGPYGGFAISAGSNYTCALTPAGAADCWGSISDDQPGPFTEISAGSYYTCARTPAGAADCWGENGQGQATDQPGPYTQIAAGEYHTCALTPTGAAECWGRNNYGQATGHPGPYTQVTVGRWHTCALTPAGAAECWGGDMFGDTAGQPGPYTQISSDYEQNCALTPAGAIDCWGYNADGQAADQPGPYTQVSVGERHTCALTPSGAAECWGRNDYGETDNRAGPYTQISAAYRHTCALTPSGAAECWGGNFLGELGGPPSISNAPPEGTVGVAYSFAYTSPPADVQAAYSLDSGSLPPGLSLGADGELAGTPTTQGNYVFLARASSLFKPDDIEPFFIRIYSASDTSIDTAPVDPSNSSSAVFGYTGTTPGSTFECDLDSGGFATCGAGGETYTGLADGPHTFSVRSTNPAGSTDATPASYAWTVDTTAPSSSIDSGPSGTVSSATATFTFSSDDPAATFRCSLDGDDYAACTGPKSYFGLADGAHTFDVKARDAAGNIDDTPARRIWSIDTTPPDTTGPDTTIDAFPPDPSASTTASFDYSSSETGSTFECKIDLGSYASCAPSGKTYSSLSEGSYTFYVRATDAALNVDATPASYTWTVDTTAPDTTILTKPTDPSSSTSADFTFSSVDPAATFRCRLDAASWASCTSPESYTGLAEGSHTFAVKATDVAGNTGDLATHIWSIDATAPDTSFDVTPADPSASSSALFGFSSTEPASTFACRLDVGSWSACSSGIKSYSGLADGSHTFDVKATDAAGNTDVSWASFTWTINTTPPDIAPPDTTILTKPADLTASTDADFTFSGSDVGGSGVASFECQLDSLGWEAPCSSPKSYTGLANGSHTFEVKATDVAGNTDASPASFTWIVTSDTHQPDALILLGRTYLGNGIFDTTALGESVSKTVARGRTASFGVKIHNDGNHPDSFKVAGCASTPGFTVTYMAGARNVTSEVTAGTYTTTLLAALRGVTLTAKIRAASTATVGAVKSCLIASTSVGDATKQDAVQATATVK